MSRPRRSKNKEIPQKIIQADETERLEYLSALLLEIAEEELRDSEAELCSQN